VHVEPQSDAHPGCRLTFVCVSPLVRKTKIKICILKGPSCNLALLPTLPATCVYRKNRKSEPCLLALSSDDVEQVYTERSLNIRVALVDCDRGAPHRSFTSVQTSGDVEESSGSSSATDDSRLFDNERDELLGDDDYNWSNVWEDVSSDGGSLY